MGLLLNTPSIGCAKSPLRVQFKPPKRERGSLSKMMYGHEQVGVVLRTRDGINPLYISPGHMVDLPPALKWFWTVDGDIGFLSRPELLTFRFHK